MPCHSPLIHTPISPIGTDVIGEVVMVERWQALMNHYEPLAAGPRR